MYVLQRTMFDDVGMKFLKTVLGGLVKDVISCEKVLSVSAVITLLIRKLSGDEAKIEKHIKKLLKYLDGFLHTFTKHVELCPM